MVSLGDGAPGAMLADALASIRMQLQRNVQWDDHGVMISLSEDQARALRAAATGPAEPSDPLMVPVPAEFDDPTWPEAPKLVHVQGVLARRNRDAVWWYEIAALCHALLWRASPPREGAAPSEPLYREGYFGAKVAPSPESPASDPRD
jgi:hypothetical protein